MLAVAGELDLLAPPATVARAHAAIRDHKVITVEHAAHSIHWEQPQAVADAILGFLS